MKKILLAIVLLLSLSAFAQQSSENLTSSIMLNFGRNFHGTGDLWGYQYGLSYNHYFSSRFFSSIALEGTLNSDDGLLFIYEDPDRGLIDGTLHDVTGGFQMLGGVGFSFIKSQRHTAGISPSILARYETTSINSSQEILYPEFTGLAFPIRVIDNYGNQKSLTAGVTLKLFYNYQLKTNWLINVTGSTQKDTNGNTISAAMLGIGKAFN